MTKEISYGVNCHADEGGTSETTTFNVGGLSHLTRS